MVLTLKETNKKAGPSLADIGLGKINALYRLERAIKDESVAERYAQRQKIALPLLADVKRWLEKNLVKTDKDGLTYNKNKTAINYTNKP